MIHLLTNTYHLHPVPSAAQVELDMGCGKGRFTLALAQRYPERVILGSDVMIGRLRRLEAKRKSRGLDNLSLLRAESGQLVSFQLPPASVDRLHLLCPDPWPKARHQVRRLVCTEFLCRLRRILKAGAILHLSTDHRPYFDEWLQMLAAMPFYEPYPEGIDDIRDLKTDFELQWNAMGKEVRHLCYRVADG
ncbi:MAG: methyltransferase domain-containing protein [Lentisphaerae bacterium]|nr:methyltransferase domain-containing protein [Lentisphaerota bacterium]